jgi:hypothetical protein
VLDKARLLILVLAVPFMVAPAELPVSKALNSAGSATAEPADYSLSSEALEKWRETKYRSIWKELHFNDPPLSDSELRLLLNNGDASGVDPEASPTSFFLSGMPSLEPSPTGLLLAGSGEYYWPHCTVVLTRPNLVLTARHCVESLPDRTNFKVFFPREGFRDTDESGIRVYCAKGDGSCSSRFDDLAAIRLSDPYSFIPLASEPGYSGALSGVLAKAQGFGDSNLILADRGILKAGRTEISNCTCGHGYFEGSGHICTRIDYGTTDHRPGYYVPYGGGSGGPLFMQSRSGFRLIGIASRLSRDCVDASSQEGRYIDLRLPRYKAWLSEVFCDKSCSDASVNTIHELLNVPIGHSDQVKADQRSITIPESTRELIITLNHELNGFSPNPGGNLDIDLPQSPDADCTRYHGVESCTVQNPAAGDYSIGVRRVRGTPAYQLTVVAIGGDDDRH